MRKNYPITTSLLLGGLLIILLPICLALITSPCQYCCSISIIQQFFGDKPGMWTAFGTVFTGLAIAISIIWQIERNGANEYSRKKNLAYSLITELEINFETAYLNGFEVSFQTNVFEQVLSNSKMLNDKALLKKLGLLYTYSRYYENIVVSKTSERLLMSDKLTWLQIKYWGILRDKLPQYEKLYDTVIGLEPFQPESDWNKAIVNLLESKGKWISYEDSVVLAGELPRKPALKGKQELVYKFIRGELSKLKNRGEISKAITEDIKYKLFELYKES